MSAFTGPLTLTQTKDWRVWTLRTPLVYEVGEKGSGDIVRVPRGFSSDGASIPRPLWWLLPTWGVYSRAAVVHDYLYVRLAMTDPHPLALNRRAADAIFLEAMDVSGVPKLVRYAMWATVRIFGGINFFKRLAVAG